MLLAGALVGEQPVRVDHEAGERRQDRFAWLALADRIEQRRLERLKAVVDQRRLGRKVVVDGLRIDLGCPRDLGDGDRVEAVLEEQAHRCVGDELPCALLLAFAESGLLGHVRCRRGVSASWKSMSLAKSLQ